MEVSLITDTIQDFLTRTLEDVLNDLPVEKRLEGVPTRDRLEGVPMADLLAALTPEQRPELARQLGTTPSTLQEQTEQPDADDKD